MFGGVNLGINCIGLIFRVNLLVIYFWQDGRRWRLILLLEVVLTPNHPGIRLFIPLPMSASTLEKKPKFSFHAEIPAYRDYNRIQPGNNMAISARVTCPIIIQ